MYGGYMEILYKMFKVCQQHDVSRKKKLKMSTAFFLKHTAHSAQRAGQGDR